MGIFSSAQVLGLRRIAERALETDVTIQRRTTTDSAYGDNDTEVFTTTETLKGWLRSMPEDMVQVSYGQTQVPASHRLFLPVGTDIRPYDKVLIGGTAFKVIDTSQESTYRVLLRVMLRKSE